MNNEITELGTLDKEIYSCISSSILTDRVIITEKQLNHILDKHPDVYNDIITSLKETISHPDYIIKDDKHPDTGLVIKLFKSDCTYLHLVLKICTSPINDNHVNTVISSWKISQNRLDNYLRNKNLLYKKE